MTGAEARALCDRWLPLWTGNQPAALIEAYADEVFYRDPARPGGVQGRAALLAYLRALLARFPDWTWAADEVFPLDGGFALRWRATIPVGTTVVRETGLDLVLVADGRITRNEVYFDRAALLEAMRG
jgi:ketosteroid isomerase-like protein